MKACTKCGSTSNGFYADKRNKDGLQSQCKACQLEKGAEWREKNADRVPALRRAQYERKKCEWSRKASEWKKANRASANASNGRRRAASSMATPAWSNPKYVRLWYQLARMESKRTGKAVHVDHIVPLIHPLVCGLHCEDNMQLLFAADNMSKQNRHWENMP